MHIMHAIVESRPGDEAALYLLGNEQEVQETTQYLANLAEGARLSGFQNPEASHQGDDITIVENFQATLVDPFRQPNKLPAETGVLALGLLSTGDRALYDEAYIEAMTARIDSGALDLDSAAEMITRHETIKDDFVILNEYGLESYVKDGQVKSFARTLEDVIDLEPPEEDQDDIDIEKMKREEPKRYAAAEAMAKLIMTEDAVRPLDYNIAFVNPKDEATARSVGATAFTKQYMMDWDQNGTPSLRPGFPHLVLWKEGDDPRVPRDPVVTILSPDHPVRQHQS